MWLISSAGTGMRSGTTPRPSEVNRFLQAGFTPAELELLRARCLSWGGTDPIWDELEQAYQIKLAEVWKPLDSTS